MFLLKSIHLARFSGFVPPYFSEKYTTAAMYFADFHHRLLAHLRARLECGELTERRLARLAGLSQSHLHNVLKGARRLSNELADQILRHLRITLLDLLTPEERAGHPVLWASVPATVSVQSRRGRI